MSETLPWTRLKGERSKAFDWFCKYRDLGPDRSLDKLHQNFTKTSPDLRQLKNYSSQNNWLERAEAYDDYLEEKTRLENEKEISEMNKRHAENAILIQEKAIDDLTNVDYSTEFQASPEGRRTAAARTWKIGVDSERLARGVATEKVEQSGTIKQRHSGKVEGEPHVNEFNKIMDGALKKLDEDVEEK